MHFTCSVVLLDVGPVGERRVMLESRPEFDQSVGTEGLIHEVRVAHVHYRAHGAGPTFQGLRRDCAIVGL